MRVNDLLKVLPPFDGIKDVIVRDDQTTWQIMKEILEAHQFFAGHYDNLVGQFNKDSLLKDLFNFCMKYLPYEAESEDLQTTRSPAAILSMRDVWGSDCKHFAGWIGGVIDAYNRAGLTDFDWCYRFASYKLLNPTKDHVFIVVYDNDREIWLDPAPIEEEGYFTARWFNDRQIVPFYETNKIPEMSIERIMGIQAGGAIGYMPELFTAAYDEGGYGGGGGGGGEVYYSINYIEPVSTPQVALKVDTPYYNDLPVSENDSTVVMDYNKVVDNPPDDYAYTPGITEKVTTNAPAPTNAGSFKINFDVWGFVKNNPVETILISAVVGTGLYFLLKPRKKKKRA